MRSLATFLALSAAVAVTAAASRAHWHDPDLAKRARITAIEEHIAQSEPGGVLLVGDSTAERWQLLELCGLPVVNAGIGRVRAGEILPIAQHWKDELQPSIVIASIGNNDDRPAAAANAFSRAIGADYLVPIDFGTRPDGAHLTAASYEQLRQEVSGKVCR